MESDKNKMVRGLIYILLVVSFKLNAQVGDTLCDLRNIAFHSVKWDDEAVPPRQEAARGA